MRSQSFGVTIMAGLGCKEKCGTNSLIDLFPHIFPQHLLDPVEKKIDDHTYNVVPHFY